MIRCRGSYQGQGFVVVVVCSCVRVCECEDSCDGQGSLFEIVADNFFFICRYKEFLYRSLWLCKT